MKGTPRGRHSRGRGPARRSHRLFPRIGPPSIRASLVIVALIPFVVAAVLCSSVLQGQFSSLRQANAARQSSRALDALLQARVSVYDEYVPSAALVAARVNHLSEAQLDSLLNTNFGAQLTQARKELNDQPAFRPGGLFADSDARLVALRRSIDQGTASSLQVEDFFTELGSKMDATWQETFNQLLTGVQASDPPETRSRLTALGKAFSAFTSGLGEESLKSGGSLETVLTAPATPGEIQGLIVSQEQFAAATMSFPSGIGPNAAKAWRSLTESSLDAEFSRDVQLGIATGLAHAAPPLATNPAGIGRVAKAEVAWEVSLKSVVLAASADLRSATARQTSSATHELYLVIAGIALLLAAEIVAVMIAGRAVRRPLSRIVSAATLVREGELELPELDESGPRELALAASAFNDMSSTLRAVQEQAIALARGELDDPALQRSLPGRTGAALQSALLALQESVRANEHRRVVLAERASRDSLTGLLNRGAAFKALKLDLASVRRSNGELELTVLFVDIDDLKSINDTYGHDRGDAAIQRMADALKLATRESDVVARIGGDEFIVGSVGRRDSGASSLLAGRIDWQLSDLNRQDDDSFSIGCSIGAAVSEPSDDRVEVLLERADRALYVAKANGRREVSRSAAALSF
jgi:diguanylate cyclase (GGDEF)-like protein